MINIKSVAYGSLLVCGAWVFSACDDSFTPAPERMDDLTSFLQSPEYSAGILTNIYSKLPYGNDWDLDYDMATNDCINVSNNYAYNTLSSSWSATTGGKNASVWGSCLSGINYCNIYIENMDKTDWTGIEIKNELFNQRAKGEVYCLRGLFGYHLLRNVGGKAADGSFLGYPIMLTSLQGAEGEDYNTPRNSIQECVDQIIADLNVAIEQLPTTYVDVTVDQVPEYYKSKGVTADIYNLFLGKGCTGLVNGLIAKAVKAQLLLLVTSPAYAGSTSYSTADAAKAAAEVISLCGGVDGIDPEGAQWYTIAEERNYTKEVIWRPNIMDAGHDIEQKYLPPSLWGNGTLNPSQNLVDAFPMADGTPIDQSAKYDASNPFENRDPRLDMYILHDGSKFGDKTLVYGSGSVNDGIGGEQGKASRTGYYMKKHLSEKVVTNEKGEWTTNARHIYTYIRLTEILLDYAESANDAYGPKADGGNGFSAYDIIKAIRQRAGIAKDATDNYLDACAASKDEMAKLIKNERRLELCFENHRFYDLRRWNDLAELNKSLIAANGAEVNKFSYKDYMIYSPVPNAEILKFSNLVQNQGW